MSVPARVSSRWLVVPQRRPEARRRLYCFPYAGASAPAFRPWAQRLAPEIELAAIQLPGRGSRYGEPAIRHWESLVTALLSELSSPQDRPFFFFGHSMGALLAYEVTRRLRDAGNALPMHLIVSGIAPPHLFKLREPLHALADAELLAKLRELNGTPQELLAEPATMTMLLPIVRADFEALSGLSTAPALPLPVPITVFGGREDRAFATLSDLEAWAERTTGPCPVHLFPGDHFFIHSSQDAVLAELGPLLAQEARS